MTVTQERDDYMRRQEADHALLGMRDPLHTQRYGRALRPLPSQSIPPGDTASLDADVTQRTDADLLRLIAADHQRLTPNGHHSADCLRQIADRIAASTQGSQGREAVVTQADREAAANIMPFEGVYQTLEWDGVVYAKVAILRGGGDDHPCVQAFARHRLASTQGSQGREADCFAAGVEAAAKAVRRLAPNTYAGKTFEHSALTAIRALIPVREAEAISTASEGRKMVPVVPTKAMLEAGHAQWLKMREATGYSLGEQHAGVYAAILAASPKVASDTAPGVTLGREEIAEIIDPMAFSERYIGNRAMIKGPGALERRAAKKAVALAKADAILAALSASPSDSKDKP
jgi:hypothetical protein